MSKNFFYYIQIMPTLPKDIVEYIISFDPKGLIKREKERERKKIQIVCSLIENLMMRPKNYKYSMYDFMERYRCGGNFHRLFGRTTETEYIDGDGFICVNDEGFKMNNNQNGYWMIIHQGNKILMKSN